MKYLNDDAMAMAGIIFGIFCLVVVVGSVMYVMAVNGQTTSYTDTFGNTPTAITNTSKGLVNTTVTIGTQSVVPIILIGGVIAVCAIVFMIYAASKLTR